MKKNVPDDKRIQTILDLICALDAGMPERAGEAQAVYIMALYDHSRQPGFVSRLLSCFSDDQSDQQLVNAINREFGSGITVEEYSNVVSNIRSAYIDLEDYYDPTKKNNLDLVQWAKEADATGWGYLLGTYGQVLSRSMFEAKLAQYPDDIEVPQPGGSGAWPHALVWH